MDAIAERAGVSSDKEMSAITMKPKTEAPRPPPGHRHHRPGRTRAPRGIAAGMGVHDTPERLTLIALLAAAMGTQNAIVRRLAVPGLTTTVLTMTVTG
jgi:hypothetical protein